VSSKFNLKKEFVIYVGDINYNKNLTLLAKSCVKNNINLVLVGKNASKIDTLDLHHPELIHLSELNTVIKQSDLIQPLGFVSDEELVCLYNLATITCMPSYSEGFGLSVIESLACGTPVICSNTSSLDEFDSESIFKFNPFSETDLGELLIKVFNNKQMLKKLSPTAIDYSKGFTWNKVATDTYNTYKRYI
jgi:glycosyltransferase involved in cell wall biosynthesis